jgi:hypothetical protein
MVVTGEVDEGEGGVLVWSGRLGVWQLGGVAGFPVGGSVGEEGGEVRRAWLRQRWCVGVMLAELEWFGERWAGWLCVVRFSSGGWCVWGVLLLGGCPMLQRSRLPRTHTLFGLSRERRTQRGALLARQYTALWAHGCQVGWWWWCTFHGGDVVVIHSCGVLPAKFTE